MDVELSQESLAILTAEAEYLNQTIPDLLRDIIADKARRLFYVQRSRKRKTKLPETWQQAQVVGRWLLDIYYKPGVAERLGKEIWMPAVMQIQDYMKAGELAMLNNLRDLQLWTKKGS